MSAIALTQYFVSIRLPRGKASSLEEDIARTSQTEVYKADACFAKIRINLNDK